MNERRKLFALLLDEIALTAIYIIVQFPFKYFLVLISILVIKDIFIVIKVWDVMSRENLLGMESLINKVGIVVKEINPVGQIKIENELWKAESNNRIRKGEKVIVISVEGLCLKVEKYKGKGGRSERERVVKIRQR